MDTMENYASLRQGLEYSLMKTISNICQMHLNKSQCAVSIEGLIGVTLRTDHTFLFNIKETTADSNGYKETAGDSSTTHKRKHSSTPIHSNNSSLEDITPTFSSPNSNIRSEINKDERGRASPRIHQRDYSRSDEDFKDRRIVQVAGTEQYAALRKTPQQRIEVVSLDASEDMSDSESEIHPAARRCSPERTTGYDNNNKVASSSAELCTSSLEKRQKLQAESTLSVPSGSTQISTTARELEEVVPVFRGDETQATSSTAGVNTELDESAVSEYSDVLKVTETGVIFCKICNQVFSSLCSGKRHVNFKHLKKGASCPICQKLLRNNTELGDHVISVHSGERYNYMCEECNKGFKTRHTLRDHIQREHRGKRRFRCHLCDEGFHTSNTCQNHLRTKHPHCDNCGMSVVTLDGHNCISGQSFVPLPTGTATGIISGQPGPSQFKLNKKALGALAKTVAEHVVSAVGEDEDNDKSYDQSNHTNRGTSQNTEPDIDRHDSEPEPGEILIRPIYHNQSKSLANTSRTDVTGHIRFVQNDEAASAAVDHASKAYVERESRTPSPTPSEQSDCTVTYLCDVCKQNFQTQEEYHAHIVQHPWCSNCYARVHNLVAHRPQCRGFIHYRSQRPGWRRIQQANPDDEPITIDIDD